MIHHSDGSTGNGECVWASVLLCIWAVGVVRDRVVCRLCGSVDGQGWNLDDGSLDMYVSYVRLVWFWEGFINPSPRLEKCFERCHVDET